VAKNEAVQPPGSKIKGGKMADVTLKLSLGAFSIEVSGPQEYVDQKVTEFVGKFLPSPLRSVNPSESSAASNAITTDVGGKKLAAAEFLKRISHTNQQDRALALGYYLEKVEGLTSFTTKELLEASRQAKYPFSNISESVSRLVGRGLMMSAGDKEGARAYSLTASGEQQIESTTSAT
jgi:hypothetical protein